MSTKKRKTERKNCPADVLEEARKLIEKGQSKRSVAEAFGMPESSLRKRLKRGEPATKLGRYETTFTEQIEEDFCNYLKLLDDMYFGLTAKRLRELAFEFAVANNIPHRFNTDTKLAGKGWLRGFRSRHPEISLRQPTSTSIARAMAFNRPQVERFYINLMVLQDRYNFPPHRIFNMDETGFTTVPNKPSKVLSTKGKRSVSKISSAERGVNITAVNAMSASGVYVPPAFIFKRKRMKPELLDGAPAGSIGMISDSSYINSDLFLDWLSHFKDYTKPTKENPVLLILDNHVSHCTIRAINFYRDNHIHVLTLPPHTSHKIQPLDCGFHTVLKKYYANECEKWLRNHPGRAITVFQMVAIFSPAYLKAATLACAVQCFKVTGIVPYDPDVFTDADYLASSVTERKRGDDNAESATDVPLVDSGASIVSEAIPQTSRSPLMDLTNVGGPTNSSVISTEHSAANESPMQPTAVSSHNTNSATTGKPKTIMDICPIPKAQPRPVSQRKHKKSDIISSSPYKIEIEKQEAQKKPKPKLKIHIQRPQTSKTQTSKAKKVKKDFKKPKKTPKKKIWKCGGCREVYKEPIIEDWIECDKCKEWWHEKCTAYLGLGSYECDVCTHK
ncbi:uncharacterized protein LOC133523371 [Cydia pomonella]|uniref:uncharacterized protein LOC133523371 n=1 Tax=Cydia pomonella TaxID=82600 RepID=UPI002ADD8187|nr:uncharacterized protein LOC133523371 [Cydia pomonella]